MEVGNGYLWKRKIRIDKMKPLEIDCFFNTDQTTQLKKLDIDYPIADCEKRKVTFYAINGITTFIDTDGTEYGEIHIGDSQFITPLKYVELKKLIES